jgi:hypothetical protein
MFTVTFRIRNAPDLVEAYPDMDTAVRVIKACTELPGNQITGWELDY